MEGSCQKAIGTDNFFKYILVAILTHTRLLSANCRLALRTATLGKVQFDSILFNSAACRIELIKFAIPQINHGHVIENCGCKLISGALSDGFVLVKHWVP